jgi:hypothetical protein
VSIVVAYRSFPSPAMPQRSLLVWAWKNRTATMAAAARTASMASLRAVSLMTRTIVTMTQRMTVTMTKRMTKMAMRCGTLPTKTCVC